MYRGMFDNRGKSQKPFNFPLQHDGIEKKHAWFLEHVEVTNMKTEQVWLFMCKNWISLFHGDMSLKKVLQGQRLESVLTGNKRLHYQLSLPDGLSIILICNRK